MSDTLLQSDSLRGIRVIEYGRFRAVRLAGMLLAEQGADVAVVINRRSGHSGDSDPDMIVYDRYKSIVTLPSAPGQYAGKLCEFFAAADIVLTDISSDDADFQRLRDSRKTNEGLIIAHVPGFPATDPRHAADWTEELVGAAAGLYESQTGLGAPRIIPLPVVSTLTALHAAAAVVFAVVERLRSGRGQVVEISHYTSALACQVLNFMIKSSPPRKWLPFQMLASPFMGVFQTRNNSHVYLHLGIPRHLRTFLFTIGKAGFTEEKKELKRVLSGRTLRDPVAVGGVREAIGIVRIFKSLFAKADAAHWEDLLGGAGLCCTRIRTLRQWIEDCRSVGGNEFRTIAGPDGNQYTVPAPLFYQVNGADKFDNQKNGGETEVLHRWQRAAQYAVHREIGPRRPPLDGVRVLDFSRVIAGPLAGRILSEYGAEVLAVTFRDGFLSWEEPFHVAFGGGKKSVEIDLRSNEGKSLFNKLFTEFKPHIILHNFPKASACKLGLDEETVRQLLPGVVFAVVSSYRQSGPWGDRVGFEWNNQASTGIMKAISSLEKPGALQMPLADFGAGLIAAFGCALAWLRFCRAGEGSRIEADLCMPSYLVQLDRLNGSSAESVSEKSNARWVRTRTGYLIICAHDNLLNRLQAMPIFRRRSPANASIGWHAVERVFKARSTGFWKGHLGQQGILYAARKKTGAILREDIGGDVPFFGYKEHDGLGPVLVCPLPVRFDETPLRVSAPASPIAGDTGEIYRRFGLDFSDISGVKPSLSRKVRRMTLLGRLAWLLVQIKWIVVLFFKYRR